MTWIDNALVIYQFLFALWVLAVGMIGSDQSLRADAWPLYAAVEIW